MRALSSTRAKSLYGASRCKRPDRPARLPTRRSEAIGIVDASAGRQHTESVLVLGMVFPYSRQELAMVANENTGHTRQFLSPAAPSPGAKGKCPHRAFKLVELLVVIAIIGILIALLISAMQAVLKALHELKQNVTR